MRVRVPSIVRQEARRFHRRLAIKRIARDRMQIRKGADCVPQDFQVEMVTFFSRSER